MLSILTMNRKALKTVLLLITIHCLGCASLVQNDMPYTLKGQWYEVKQGDTLSSIAKQHSTDVDTLAELNDINGSEILNKREKIFVPMQEGTVPGAQTKTTNILAEQTAESNTYNNSSSLSSAQESNPATHKTAQTSCVIAKKLCLEWPLTGKVSAAFGSYKGKPHDGIDISADQGTLIRAAADGTVLYSGNGVKGYGNLIIIKHEGSLITVYAHNNKNLVIEGGKVTKGSIIAEVGQTGNATSPHLHFEVRLAETPQNPLEYLPEIP